ncbi:MAG: DUF1161 domain-containing protein [Dokdonella sp.]
MKSLLMLALMLPFAANAQSPSTRKSCDELKTEIAAKIEKNGVNAYMLEIVSKDAQTHAKVVGSCNGGEQRIVYQRGILSSEALDGRRVAAAHR